VCVFVVLCGVVLVVVVGREGEGKSRKGVGLGLKFNLVCGVVERITIPRDTLNVNNSKTMHQPFILNKLKVVYDWGVSKHMKSRGLIYTLLVIAILVLLFFFLAFGVSPPEAPNGNIIRFGSTNWSLDNNSRFYGVTVWSVFADYSGNATVTHSNTIKVENTILLGRHSI
jgi:hypothetical protein